jgi:hypothetical protein
MFVCYFVYMNLIKDITGVKVEGILRQAAYVEDVERRIREYEQGGFVWIYAVLD